MMRSHDDDLEAQNHHHYSSPSLSQVSNIESTTLDYINHSLPLLDLCIDENDLFQSARDLLHQIFPHWKPPQHIQIEQCTDGITNKLLKCSLQNDQEAAVLVKVYGHHTEAFIDRHQEIQTFVTFAAHSLCPALHARFRNGIVYEFVPGRPLKPKELSDPMYRRLIACRLAQWHAIDVGGPRKPRLFKLLRNLFRDLPKSTDDFAWIEEEISRLETVIVGLECPVVFCHNDLLSGNIIYQEQLHNVSFIDYEYGGWNYRSYDIANHFCEWAGFQCTYAQDYPSEDVQREWIRTYLETYYGQSCTDEHVEKVCEEVRVFSAASHLFWGMWALFQAAHSDISFDYRGYAMKRFEQLKTGQENENH